jgi:hypothetical protein
MTALLTTDQIVSYRERGWILLDGLLELSPDALRDAVDEVATWGDEGEWMNHYEMTDYGRQLARSENFTPFSPALFDLLRTGAVARVAGELLGEAALLYKEKINYKLIGGAGFSPHQDQPAYPYVTSVLSVMIAVDDSTVENGCLFVATARHQELLAQDERGCLAPEVVADLEWMPVELRAGQTLFFHSLTPHRSGPNLSTKNRRALYPTYNGISEGDLRDAYYATKKDIFAHSEASDRVQLSLIGDFEGRPA